MSSSRSRTLKITEDELNDLIFRLQELLPQLNPRHGSRVSASKLLKETCSYIRKLQKEVDDLSERLSRLLDSMDTNGVDIESLRSFLQL
ncbi:hypothetical protein Tsubulata_011915 [Turnera subulata]|uniref:BHLH domain-containing protein n=1 Tax=Turnera subulata TaxID=218843 RepID=A0A9Q0F3D6_9ROSI|nr:hypothetical protein Tsubulata_011915 [Turnera subulata]